MNVLVAVSIVPYGIGGNLSPEVAEVIRVIESSGLPCRTTSMFTEIEGEWDEVMKVVKEASFVPAEKGLRTGIILKADIKPGRTNTMKEKVEKIDSILGGKRG